MNESPEWLPSAVIAIVGWLGVWGSFVTARVFSSVSRAELKKEIDHLSQQLAQYRRDREASTQHLTETVASKEDMAQLRKELGDFRELVTTILLERKNVRPNRR